MSAVTLVLKSSLFRDITPCSYRKLTDVTEEYLAFIFSVEEQTKQKPSLKQLMGPA
jgi:hypothetical protein